MSTEQIVSEFDQLLQKLNNDKMTKEDWDLLKIACRDKSLATRIFESSEIFEKLLCVEKNDLNLSLWPLANILFHLPDARHKASKHHDLVLYLNNKSHSEGTEPTIQFIQLRVLFLLSIDREGAQTLHKAEFINNLEKFTINHEYEKSLIEILRILFNVTHFAPLPSNDCKSLTILSEFLRQCLAFPAVDVMGNAFNVLLNFSLDVQPTTDGALLLKGLDALLNQSTGLDYWPAACMAVARLARNNDSLRRFLRRAILPSVFDRTRAILPSPDDSGKCSIKENLQIQLSSNDDRQVQATGDFLNTLLTGHLSRLIYHFGYGPVAGYLYARGIVELPADRLHQGRIPRVNEVKEEGEDHKEKDNAELELGNSSDEEEIKAGALQQVDLVTGQWARHLRPEEEDDRRPMTEEEKARESERLLDLFERLGRNGIVKMYTTEGPR